MKLYCLFSFLTAAACVCGGLAGITLAQEGTSSGSVSRTRSGASQPQQQSPMTRKGAPSRNRNQPGYDNEASNFVAPDDVVVDEFINYHRHRLPMPKVGQSVAMDVRWGNDVVSPNQPEAVLQIGFTTPAVGDREDLRPINLSLVIDRSGSMQAADKMSRVKQSLQTMFGQLRENDIVSIVVFDTNAEVLLAAGRVGDGRALRRAVDSIEPNGATNINAGLMLGYREAMKNYLDGATNRVILLTDGIANQGETEPTKIAQNSLRYNEEGVDLSTIGVGAQLDTDLHRTLAKSGRGLYHFIAENQDIEKVFVNEIQSLISPVARRVELTVDYDQDLQVEKIYGYEPRMRGNTVSIPIDDMNNGLTQVVMMRFRLNDDSAETESRMVRVRLSYFDFKKQKTVQETQNIELRTVRRNVGKQLADSEVKKNYTIALLAQSIADMTAAAKRGDYHRAESFLDIAIATANTNFPTMEDKDVRYILNIVENYQTNLRGYNRRGD